MDQDGRTVMKTPRKSLNRSHLLRSSGDLRTDSYLKRFGTRLATRVDSAARLGDNSTGAGY
jgi:hypothetical protein